MFSKNFDQSLSISMSHFDVRKYKIEIYRLFVFFSAKKQIYHFGRSAKILKTD